ncbi:hypothetical protein ID0233_14190 [Helicobacter pylori]
MRDEFYDDEGNVIAEGDEATAMKLKERGRITPPPYGVALFFFFLIFLFLLIDSDQSRLNPLIALFKKLCANTRFRSA